MKRKEDFSKLTTAQFAALHEVNKRTLHYYDSIELFSPETKGDNHLSLLRQCTEHPF